MRKLLIRIINILYIIAAGIAVYSLCTRPIFKASVKAHFTSEKMGEIVSTVFKTNDSEEESSEEGESRLVYRDSPKMGDFLTPEKIRGYFPNGYDLVIPVEIPVKKALDFKNTKLLDELIQDNLYSVIDKVVDSVDEPIHKLFKDIFEGYAVSILKEQITAQIKEHFPDGADATDDEVNAVFENVYSLLDDGEPVTVDTLANTILHGKSDGEGGTTGSVLDIINARGSKYVLLTGDDKPTEEQVTADLTAQEEDWQYFIIDQTLFTHNTKEYKEGTTYYKKLNDVPEFGEWSPKPTAEEVESDRNAAEGEEKYYLISYTYKHNDQPFNSSTDYYKKTPYTNDDVDEDKITDAMVESLEKVDGLVTKVPKLCEPQPEREDVEEDIAKEEKDRIYYILDGEGNPILPQEYSSEVQYYTVDKIVNDIDSAMNALIDGFLNGSSGGSNDSRAIVREEDAKTSEDSLKETLKNYLLQMLPKNVSEASGPVGQYAPYILFALVVMFALPWAWFAFITLIRTLRPRKCWTRLGIVIWGALFQVVLGILLTYGTKYLWPYIAERVDALKDFADAINFDIRTGCLIPSFVWLGVVISAIPYWIIRRPVKRLYKLEQRAYSRYR